MTHVDVVSRSWSKGESNRNEVTDVTVQVVPDPVPKWQRGELCTFQIWTDIR
jgi:hypothetical protein